MNHNTGTYRGQRSLVADLKTVEGHSASNVRVKESVSPLLFDYWNTPRNIKAAVASKSSETLIRRSDGDWFKVTSSALGFDLFNQIDAPVSRCELENITFSDGTSLSGVSVYWDVNAKCGGDFGVRSDTKCIHRSAWCGYLGNNNSQAEASKQLSFLYSQQGPCDATGTDSVCQQQPGWASYRIGARHSANSWNATNLHRFKNQIEAPDHNFFETHEN